MEHLVNQSAVPTTAPERPGVGEMTKKSMDLLNELLDQMYSVYHNVTGEQMPDGPTSNVDCLQDAAEDILRKADMCYAMLRRIQEALF